MKASAIKLGHDVEKEGIRVIVQCLVIQKELGQQTEILGVKLWRKTRDGDGFNPLWTNILKGRERLLKLNLDKYLQFELETNFL